MKKLSVLLTLLLLLLLPLVSAQDANEDPGITPDSVWWGIDVALDKIGLALTFNKAKRSEKALVVAQERLMEVKAMIEQNQIEHAIKAQEKHDEALETSEEAMEEIEDPEDLENIQAKLQSHYEMVVQVKTTILERQRERMTGEQIAHVEEVFGHIMERAEQMETKIAQHKEDAGIENRPVEPPVGEPPEEPGKPEDAGKGKLELMVSDAPADIADFDSLTVEFSKTRIFMGEKPIGKSLEGKSADLTQLVGDKALEILSTELDAGTYTKVELYVSLVTGIIDGEEVEVTVPSNKLRITKNFEIVAGQETTFVFDINVVKKGSGEYNLLPVISKSGVVGDDIDDVDEICTVDEDCDAGSVCTDGECVEETAPECVVNDDCETGFMCTDGACVEETPECTLDEDCETGFVCTDSVCVEETLECTVDEDCETGFVCTDSACVEETLECTVDEDCETGFVCTNSTCVEATPECTLDEDCETGFVCTDSVCVEETLECTLDEDCETGFVCTNSTCVEATPECTLDEDCETGFVCTNSTCVEATPECTLDEDCETGFVCTEGACVEEVVPECTIDDDCELGFICTDGTCTESLA